jgi:hypothetical protein
MKYELVTNFPVRTLERRLEYSDYKQVNGIFVPFGVSEFVNGQSTWSLHPEQIEFNVGLDLVQLHCTVKSPARILVSEKDE